MIARGHRATREWFSFGHRTTSPLSLRDRVSTPSIIEQITEYAEGCQRASAAFSVDRAFDLVPAARRHRDAVELILEHALASLRRRGRSGAQARLELEVRHPEFAAPIAVLCGLDEMVETDADARPGRRLDDLTGRVLGRDDADAGMYRLVRLLGHGANGSVYEAIECRGGVGEEPRVVAVKVFDTDSAWWSFDRGQFTESHRVAALPPGRVQRVLETAWSSGGEPFVVSDLATAGSLRDLLVEANRCGVRDLVRLVRDAAQGLAVAHQHGLLHGNIKPANVLLSGDRAVPAKLAAALADFGSIGRMQLAAAADPAGIDLSMDQAELQGVRDSALFAAPERLGGQSGPTVRADLFSLGRTLEFALGVAAHRGVRIDDRLAAVLGRATAPRPDDRHTSADELAEELNAWLSHRPIPRVDGPVVRASLWAKRRPRAAVATGLTLAGLLVSAGAAGVSMERAAFRAGASQAGQRLSGWLSAGAIRWEESHPLRDWLAASLLYDRLRDDEYFRHVVGDRDSPENRAAEVAHQIAEREEAGEAGTLGWALLSLELAMHQLRTRESHADTADLIARAEHALAPAMPANDPLYGVIGNLRRVHQIKTLVLNGSSDVESVREPYEGLVAMLAARSSGMRTSLEEADRRDPVVQLALRSVEHMSHPSRLNDPKVWAWCSNQHRGSAPRDEV